MDNIVVKGGNILNGDVEISSAKNAVLPIISACILNGKKNIIYKAPMLEDVFVLSEALKFLDGKVKIDTLQEKLIIDSSNLKSIRVPDELVRKMRASFLLMGPMLARFGEFKISLPGGCNIGTRPIDLHLKGLAALGAEINVGHGYVEAKAEKLIGDNIYLDFPSVGATENIMMAEIGRASCRERV